MLILWHFGTKLRWTLPLPSADVLIQMLASLSAQLAGGTSLLEVRVKPTMRTGTLRVISKDVRFAPARSKMQKDPLVFLAALSGQVAALEHQSRHSDSRWSRVECLEPFPLPYL